MKRSSRASCWGWMSSTAAIHGDVRRRCSSVCIAFVTSGMKVWLVKKHGVIITCCVLRARHQLIDAHKKIDVAAKPSPVRTACNLPHFSISARLSAPARAASVAMSMRLVGTMTMSV